MSRCAILASFFIAASALAQVNPPGSGSQPGSLDGGQPIDSAFTRCRSCHDRAISDDGDPLFLPFDGWSSTMMGNSVRDPLFQAALSVANQDTAGIGSWCLRCHAPQSYVRGDDGPANSNAFDEVDSEGVTCDVCHRAIPNPDSGVYEHGNAQIFFDPTNVKYGPYGETFESPAHASADAGFTASSELCGNCHQVENPVVPWRDQAGNILGPHFPLDTTYDEWKQSAYAQPDTLKTCQSCHMPTVVAADGGTSFSVAKFGMPRDSPMQHVFVGGNVWGLQAVQLNGANSDGGLNDQFAQTTSYAEQSLKNAADISVSIGGDVSVGGTAAVTVRVTNKTGHKLPTGYADGRRMVIQVLINGEAHTGAFDGGSLIIDAWLREYQVQHGRAGIGSEDHLALHDWIMFDSRIPPAGFSPPPGAATRDTVNWYDLPDGGFKNYDEIEWDIDVPDGLQPGDPFNVTARLLYQSTTPDYVDFLSGADTTTDAGQNLANIYAATVSYNLPFEMAVADAGTTLKMATGTGGGGGGGAGTGGAGGGTGTSTGGGTAASGAKCGCSSGDFSSLLLLAALALRRRRA